MTVTQQDKLFDKLRVLWFFINLNMLFFIVISRQRRQQNPAPAQPAPPPHPQPPPYRRRKPQNPWVMPWILQREERGWYRTLLDELITTDIPGYQNFIRMPPKVCKAILEEFQQEYFIYPTDPEEWRRIEEQFRNRWNVPHAVGALDVKHIPMKKPKKSGSKYLNYKGYFSRYC